MKLKTFLKNFGISDREFAERLCKRGHKVERSMITKIKLGTNRPGWKLCEAIHKATEGAVSATDWMDL